ncbi:MAG: endonuclease/exonuclease/phosphatase family protein [Ruminiclostridium sp.]|nr:endonuclease/exonuclease/phosphatase family protein [Ruminiclostridium sp.]
MKIMTLNTHSLIEGNYSEKLRIFVDAVAVEKPEIIALQEVNQTISAALAGNSIKGYFPCSDSVVIKADNHVYRAAEMLSEKGVDYYWTWLPLKKGYDIFEEGIAVMSRSNILEAAIIPVSKADDYNNWKTRKLLGIRTKALPDEWFFSAHYGWWNDCDDPFRDQWLKTMYSMKKYENAWLMGDFNNPAEIRGEGYDMVESCFWHDSFRLADKKDDGITVSGEIDGWRGENNCKNGMRIDHIWSRKKTIVTSSQVIFNGKNYPVISDHYGVIINYEKSIV